MTIRSSTTISGDRGSGSAPGAASRRNHGLSPHRTPEASPRRRQGSVSRPAHEVVPRPGPDTSFHLNPGAVTSRDPVVPPHQNLGPVSRPDPAAAGRPGPEISPPSSTGTAPHRRPEAASHPSPRPAPGSGPGAAPHPNPRPAPGSSPSSPSCPGLEAVLRPEPGAGGRRGGCAPSRSSPPVRVFDDRGSGTVLHLALIATAALLMTVVLTLGSAVSARHRAAAAADLAALAAVDSPSGCSAAARIATANGARLARCVPGRDGTVVVSVAVEAPGLHRNVYCTARAGPGPAPMDSRTG
ncbi:Rv3654c family TadE-like protein [Kineosporia mesophila]|uniref:Rv3654c family TadE-like protein n=1 Tax=Kineosporia mesophila TaxID=566012 RepID=UPI002F3608A5